MKLTSHQLAEINGLYIKLKKKDKVISIGDVKKRLDEIIYLTENLEKLLSDQIEVLNDFNESCEDGKCDVGKSKVSELYEFYDELEDKVLGGNLYRALYMVS